MQAGSFVYSNPGVIHWGAGCLAERLEGELQRRGAQRVFVVTTRSVDANPALMGMLREQLGERLVGVYGRIGEHAPVRSVAEAAAQAREAQPDLLLSFGGGSPIDAAKSVAFACASGLDLADPDALKRAWATSLDGRSVLPHVAIPTTLSVAELSGLAGFSTEGSREKTGLAAPELVPAAVIYDAQLSTHTPIQLWLSSGIRAVDHAVEGILAAGIHPYSDALSLEALRRLRVGLLGTHADPADLEARTQSQLGAWFSFTLPTASATGLSHVLGKRLGSRHGIPHGVTSCLVLPHVMRYLAPSTAPAQARIAEALGVVSRGMDTGRLAARAADAVSDLVARLDLPRHLAEFGLTDDDLREAVRPVASERYPAEELLGILRAAW